MAIVGRAYCEECGTPNGGDVFDISRRCNEDYFFICEKCGAEYHVIPSPPCDWVRKEKEKQRTKIARWWFTEKELESFDNTCKCSDEFIVFPSFCSYAAKEIGVLVYRDGTATNRYGDGTVGVSADDKVFAEEESDLHDPDDLDAIGAWKDVRVDEHGFFFSLIEEEK